MPSAEGFVPLSNWILKLVEKLVTFTAVFAKILAAWFRPEVNCRLDPTMLADAPLKLNWPPAPVNPFGKFSSSGVVIKSVSLALLLPGVGSVTPTGGVTEAVFTNVPVAVELSVALTTYRIVLPEG